MAAKLKTLTKQILCAVVRGNSQRKATEEMDSATETARSSDMRTFSCLGVGELTVDFRRLERLCQLARRIANCGLALTRQAAHAPTACALQRCEERESSACSRDQRACSATAVVTVCFPQHGQPLTDTVLSTLSGPMQVDASSGGDTEGRKCSVVGAGWQPVGFRRDRDAPTLRYRIGVVLVWPPGRPLPSSQRWWDGSHAGPPFWENSTAPGLFGRREDAVSKTAWRLHPI